MVDGIVVFNELVHMAKKQNNHVLFVKRILRKHMIQLVEVLVSIFLSYLVLVSIRDLR